MNLSLYIPAHSWLHRLPAGVKFSTLIVGSIVLYEIFNLYILVSALMGAIALVIYLKIPGYYFKNLFLMPFVMVLAFSLFSAFVNDLNSGFVTFFRLSSLIILAICVTVTTKSEDFISMIERALLPLSVFPFIKPAAVSMTVSLTLRFIPEIFKLGVDIKEAQAARGLQSNPVALIVPLLILTLKRADDISDAIDARTPGTSKTRE